MKGFILLLGYSLFCTTLYAQKPQTATSVLYRKILTDKDKFPELLLNGVACNFTAQGLVITGNKNVIQLNKYYSLGERLVRYHVRFSATTKAVFQSNTGDFKAIVDVPKQTISIESKPAVWKQVKIDAANEYLVEIQRHYQQSKIILTDLTTGDSQELEINADGSGGVGVGAVGSESGMAHQWDYYCFGLLEGAALTVKQICVQAMESDLTLLLYGDSITQPEGYFPAKDFPSAWTQLVMQHVKGKSISSGRGGCTIKEVLERIKNELPYVKAKYVMVTIGTNGGNTEQNLSELVEYIRANGSTPILNNIPSNEHGTQVEANLLIEKVRKKYGINGCRFDIATSLNRDGKEVDKATMWHEDYTAVNNWGHYYHHPNVKGSRLMYLQTLIDIPEIYE
ncbi:MAG: SGNH/GDSL hydrolase family protein [Agriterribacter sp.]